MVFIFKRWFFVGVLFMYVAGGCSNFLLATQVIRPGGYKLKHKNASARMRRFLKMYGREIAALAAGAAVGGLGVGFATHYFDNKAMDTTNRAHAVRLAEIAQQQKVDQERLSKEYADRIEQIIAENTTSLEQKNQEQIEAAAQYEEKLATADKEREAEVERIRQTFIKDREQEQESFEEKLAELKESFEAQSKEQALQLSRYAQAQRQQLIEHQDDQLLRLSELRGDFARSSSDVMSNVARSAQEQKELLEQNNKELRAAIQESKESLQAQFNAQQADLEEKLGNAFMGLQAQLMMYQQQLQMGFAGAYRYIMQIQQQMAALQEEGKASRAALDRQYQASSQQLVLLEQQAVLDRQKAQAAQEDVARLAAVKKIHTMIDDRYNDDEIYKKSLVTKEIVAQGGKPRSGPVSLASRPEIKSHIAESRRKRLAQEKEDQEKRERMERTRKQAAETAQVEERSRAGIAQRKAAILQLASQPQSKKQSLSSEMPLVMHSGRNPSNASLVPFSQGAQYAY